MNAHHLRSALLLLPALSAFAAGANAERPGLQKPELQKPVMVVQAGHASRVRAISFSPDGRLLASASGEGTYWTVAQPNVVKLWDVATGTELRTLDVKSLATWVGFSPDGRRVAAKGTQIVEKVQVWDVASGAELAGVKPGPEFKSSAVSSDGKIAADLDGNNIKLRDAATGAARRTLASRTSDFQKAKFSPDGGTLACGGNRLSIRVWDEWHLDRNKPFEHIAFDFVSWLPQEGVVFRPPFSQARFVPIRSVSNAVSRDRVKQLLVKAPAER